MPKDDYRYPRAFVVAMFSLIAVFACLFLTDSAGPQGNIFFLKTADYMADVNNPVNYSADLDFYRFGDVDPLPDEHAYPPLAYLTLFPLSTVGGPYAMRTAVTAFVWFLICAMFFLLLYDSFDGPKRYKLSIALSMALSGIFIFSFERGNLAILAAALSGFFCFYFNFADRRIRELALIALAIAVGLKGWPAILGLVLLFDRRKLDFLRFTAYGAFAVLFPFLFLKGGLGNIPIWIRNIGLNSESYELRDVPRFGFRYILLQVPDFSPGMALYTILRSTDLLLALIAIAAAVFHRKQWKTVTQLLLCIVLFPVNSALYSGTYLFVGILMFLNEKQRGKTDWIYLGLMILILNPVQLELPSGLSISLLIVNISAYVLLLMLVMESTQSAWRWLSTTSTDPAQEREKAATKT